MMEFNRRHIFTLGVIIFVLGLQFRVFESYVLNEKTSTFIASKMRPSTAQRPAALRGALTATAPASRRTVKPPNWIGWAMLSVGGVLMLHSLAMTGPD